jgi:hypothetical protein
LTRTIRVSLVRVPAGRSGSIFFAVSLLTQELIVCSAAAGPVTKS